MPLTVYQIDAFTQRIFSGNPAGVVPRADGLTGDQMQSIARELGNPETAFILEPDADDHDVQVRFFTPTTEVPTCGHATISAHFVRALEQGLAPGRVWQKIGAGLLPVDIERTDAGYRIVMTQATPVIDEPLDSDQRDQILQALGLDDGDLLPEAPVQAVDTGSRKVVVGLRSRDRLNTLEPDFRALVRASRPIGNLGYFVFTLTDSDPGYLTHARMFAPQIGIDEDPVTGNGNGPLGAYLVHNHLANHDGRELSFKSRQGEAMGRPGTAYVRVTIEDGRPTLVQVAGDAVVVFRTELTID